MHGGNLKLKYIASSLPTPMSKSVEGYSIYRQNRKKYKKCVIESQ